MLEKDSHYLHLESRPSYEVQGADCRKGGLKPFSLAAQWWESGPGQ